MQQNDFIVDKRIRERLGTGRKIYNLVFGAFVFTIGLTYILKHKFSIQDGKAILNEIYVLMGLLLIIVGIVGREPFRTRYRLRIDDDTIRIKKSFERELRIDLKKITQIKSLPPRLEITYNDFVKTYDFFWMTDDEFKAFHAKISSLHLNNFIS